MLRAVTTVANRSARVGRQQLQRNLSAVAKSGAGARACSQEVKVFNPKGGLEGIIKGDYREQFKNQSGHSEVEEDASVVLSSTTKALLAVASATPEADSVSFGPAVMRVFDARQNEVAQEPLTFNAGALLFGRGFSQLSDGNVVGRIQQRELSTLASDGFERPKDSPETMVANILAEAKRLGASTLEVRQNSYALKFEEVDRLPTYQHTDGVNTMQAFQELLGDAAVKRNEGGNPYYPILDIDLDNVTGKKDIELEKFSYEAQKYLSSLTAEQRDILSGLILPSPIDK